MDQLIRPLRCEFGENRKFISLFDLYFELSSPVPYRHPSFKDFRVTNFYKANHTEQLSPHEYGGYIKLNHRPAQRVFVTDPQQKNIFYIQEKWSKDNEQFYDDIYNQIYFRDGLAKHFAPLFPKGMYSNPNKFTPEMQNFLWTDDDFKVTY